MSDRRGWAAALASCVAVIAGCEPRALDPVDPVDAGSDWRQTPYPQDAMDATDSAYGLMDAPWLDAGAADVIDGWSGGCPVVQAPMGVFTFLSAGNDGTCGIRTDGSLACWGIFWSYAAPMPAGAYQNVSRHLGVCAVRITGDLDCWGLPSSVGPTPMGAYEQVVVAEDALCARSAAGQITCWGHMGYAPQQTFRSLTGGAYFMCALEANSGSAVCWEPRSGAGTLRTEAGPFVAVDTGRFFACGLRTDGGVQCWDASPMFPGAAMSLQPAPPGPFSELSTGEFHACALRGQGEVVCWGQNTYGQATPPTGLRLAHVEAGSTHTCGIQFDGTVICWGSSSACNL